MNLAQYKLHILVGVTVVVVIIVVAFVAIWASQDDETAPEDAATTAPEKKLAEAIKPISNSTPVQADKIVKDLPEDLKKQLRVSTGEDAGTKKAKDLLLLFDKIQPIGEAGRTQTQNEGLVKDLPNNLQKELKAYEGDDANTKKAKEILVLLEAVKPLNVANSPASKLEQVAEDLPAGTKTTITAYTGEDASIKKAKQILDIVDAKSKLVNCNDFTTLTKNEVEALDALMKKAKDHFEDSEDQGVKDKIAALTKAREDVFVPGPKTPKPKPKPDEFKALEAIKLSANKGLNNLNEFIEAGKKDVASMIALAKAQSGAIALDQIKPMLDALNAMLPLQSRIHAVYLRLPPKPKDMVDEKIEKVEARYKGDMSIGQWENVEHKDCLVTSDRVAVALLTSKPESSGVYQLYFKLLVSSKVLYVYEKEFQTKNPKGNFSDCPKFRITDTKDKDGKTTARDVAMLN